MTSNHCCAMAPNSPVCCFIHASMAGSRSRVPLNRRNPALTEGALRIGQARHVLLRTTDALHPHAEASQRIDGQHAPVEIERNHMRERTAKGEGLRRLAQ